MRSPTLNSMRTCDSPTNCANSLKRVPTRAVANSSRTGSQKSSAPAPDIDLIAPSSAGVDGPTHPGRPRRHEAARRSRAHRSPSATVSPAPQVSPRTTLQSRLAAMAHEHLVRRSDLLCSWPAVVGLQHMRSPRRAVRSCPRRCVGRGMGGGCRRCSTTNAERRNGTDHRNPLDHGSLLAIDLTRRQTPAVTFIQ